MTYIDPAVSAWALARIRENPRLSAEVTACLHRIPRSPEPSSERVLRAEPISTLIGLSALINGALGLAAGAAAGGLIGGTIVGVPVSLSVSFTGAPRCR
jgi:membrane associated rhomboid family serine protease